MDRDQILAKVRERIVAFVTSRLSESAADDLAQDVLMLLHEKYPHITTLSDLLPLSYRILRLKMMNAQRKSTRRREHDSVPIDEDLASGTDDDPDIRLSRQRVLEKLTKAMTQLSERCRTLFRLKLEGKRFPDIQAIMKQNSINTIYTWDRRCRERLLELMGGTWEP